jgi:hypothetical protein
MSDDRQAAHQRLAAEVLHLGQDLFATLIASVEALQTGGERDRAQMVSVEELRDASVEFFSALQLLFGVDLDKAKVRIPAEPAGSTARADAAGSTSDESEMIG